MNDIFITINGSTILGFVLFFVGLGILVSIHEFGHFIAAKSFKVYCSDFSIGFGPKIVKIKRKGSETRFSIGIIPLGGYVSMYAEPGMLPDGAPNDLGKERSIQGIKRWKRIIIYIAGITMNFVLAYVVFFIACSCFPHYQTYGYVVDYNGDSFSDDNSKIIVYDSQNKEINLDLMNFDNTKERSSFDGENSFYSLEARTFSYTYNSIDVQLALLVEAHDTSNYGDFNISTFSDSEGNIYCAGLDTSSFSINDIDYKDYLKFYKIGTAELYSNCYYLESNNGTTDKKDFNSKNLPMVNSDKEFIYYNLDGNLINNNYISFKKFDSETKKYEYYQASLTPLFKDHLLKSFNFNMYQYKYWLGLDSFKEAGSLWLQSTTAVTEAIGGLFIGTGWENVGGPVAIIATTTSTLINNPFYVYLYNWAMISVNLALLNFLPFPGLDGWHILVEIIEGIVNGAKKVKDKKKETKQDNALNSIVVGEAVIKEDTEWRIDPKVKNIISYVGLGLLFALAIVIFVLDIIKYF